MCLCDKVHFTYLLSSITHTLYYRLMHMLAGDSEVQRTMLELLNQLDGFEPKQNIKVLH